MKPEIKTMIDFEKAGGRAMYDTFDNNFLFSMLETYVHGGNTKKYKLTIRGNIHTSLLKKMGLINKERVVTDFGKKVYSNIKSS